MTAPTAGQLDRLRQFLVERYRELELLALEADTLLPGTATATAGTPEQATVHQAFLNQARPRVVAAACRTAALGVDAAAERIAGALARREHQLAVLGWTVLVGDALVFRDHADWWPAWDRVTGEDHFLGLGLDTSGPVAPGPFSS